MIGRIKIEWPPEHAGDHAKHFLRNHAELLLDVLLHRPDGLSLGHHAKEAVAKLTGPFFEAPFACKLSLPNVLQNLSHRPREIQTQELDSTRESAVLARLRMTIELLDQSRLSHVF
jgi:hypothetical protein